MGTGCAPDAEPAAPGARDTAVAELDALAWITRVSVDVRGARPSRTDLEAVSLDPRAAEAIVDAYLSDPRVGTRAAWIWNDALHTAVYFRDPPYRRLEGSPEELRAVGWQDLEVVRRLVDEDRPFSEIVTLQELPESDLTAAFWGIDGPGSGAEWVWRVPADGRPMAGLLSSSTFWLAHDDDRQNLNRQRANLIASVFTCADFFARQVDLELTGGASTAAEVEDATRHDPGCVTCHAALDPLAAAVGGFADRGTVQAQPHAWPYSPYMADWFRGWNGAAWWGTPIADLRELGQAVAADPRFPRCVVRRTAEGLFGQAVEEDDIDAWAPAFVDEDGLRLRALLGRLVRSDVYLALPPRVVTTEQLRETLVDLTGVSDDAAPDDGFGPLTWQSGLRTLGGGTDDTFVLERTREAGPGVVLVQQWAARRARSALDEDATRAVGERRLWTIADPDAAPDDATLREQLRDWYERALSIPVATDAPAIDGLMALWAAAGGQADPRGAFGACIEAIVRHPAAVVVP